ncbi:N-acetylmuramic acid 6-phosphate etherase [Acidimangrovimonas sediminis]|uniref:N-acetylmuramic acid 6-phosphate etherase n=1 Tax=Acidimangrovimonas sediminis TaxID=2056283 RepID=UPI000C7FBF44|nr:N-acetylmuramic acid 6-phosphate etherase [Acidimangrovimonas sediminis]
MAATTEQRHQDGAGLQALPRVEALRRLMRAQLASAATLEPALPGLARAAALAARALGGEGRLIYVGAGSSGLMALADRLELAGTFGIAPERTPMLFAGGAGALLHLEGATEDDPAQATADLAALAPAAGDVALCVSASGATPYTLACAEGLAAAGCHVVGIANVADSPLLAMAEVPILLDTGPEVVAGSTRMAAGTAQKIALNLVSTMLGIELGHVHEGFMVNVQADNAKLRGRASRIVAALSGAGEAASLAALEAGGGAVKPAVLIAAGADAALAARLLKTHGGHLGPALEALTKP